MATHDQRSSNDAGTLKSRLEDFRNEDDIDTMTTLIANCEDTAHGHVTHIRNGEDNAGAGAGTDEFRHNCNPQSHVIAININVHFSSLLDCSAPR